MTTVINLFAGPGSGKSTTAHGLMHHFKVNGVKAEFAHEWIKHPVWQGRVDMPQYYTWAKQQKLIDGLMGKVDFIVTDSPTLLSLVYGVEEPDEFHKMVLRKFLEPRRIDVYIDRGKEYWDAGRYQTEEEALDLDVKIDGLLHGTNRFIFPMTLKHIHVPGTKEGLETLVQHVSDVV